MTKTKKASDLPKDGSKSAKDQKKLAKKLVLDAPHDAAMASLFGQGLKITFTHVNIDINVNKS